MKTKLIAVVIINLLFAGTAYAQMGMMGSFGQYGNTETKSVLQEIYKDQNIESQGQVDCSKVTDDQFEKLGDAYMGIMLPNEQQHEVMDNMMGGEGSVSLTQAHINMGRSYLGCWSNYNSGPVYMPMMNGYGFGNYNPMMQGLWGFGTGNMIFMSIWSILAIVGIIATIKWIMNLNRK